MPPLETAINHLFSHEQKLNRLRRERDWAKEQIPYARTVYGEDSWEHTYAYGRYFGLETALHIMEFGTS